MGRVYIEDEAWLTSPIHDGIAAPALKVFDPSAWVPPSATHYCLSCVRLRAGTRASDGYCDCTARIFLFNDPVRPFFTIACLAGCLGRAGMQYPNNLVETHGGSIEVPNGPVWWNISGITLSVGADLTFAIPYYVMP